MNWVGWRAMSVTAYSVYEGKLFSLFCEYWEEIGDFIVNFCISYGLNITFVDPENTFIDSSSLFVDL